VPELAERSHNFKACSRQELSRWARRREALRCGGRKSTGRRGRTEAAVCPRDEDHVPLATGRPARRRCGAQERKPEQGRAPSTRSPAPLSDALQRCAQSCHAQTPPVRKSAAHCSAGRAGSSWRQEARGRLCSTEHRHVFGPHPSRAPPLLLPRNPACVGSGTGASCGTTTVVLRPGSWRDDGGRRD